MVLKKYFSRIIPARCYFMMECECISPPPKFDIPAPPDPSLVWHLLSDEFANELIQIQQCDTDQKTIPHSEISFAFSNLPDYFLYTLIATGALISAALFFTIIYIRIRRFNRKRGAKIKRKPEFSADIVLSSEDWPYTTAIYDNSSVINNDLLCGSSENNFRHKAVRVTPNSLRGYSYRPNKLSTNSTRNSPLQSTTIFRLRDSSNGYCTIGKLYEEIPGNKVFSIVNPENSTKHSSRRELLYGISSIRRPPPTCRPPPPPLSQDSPHSLDSCESSIEKEHDVMLIISSPKRSTDDEKSRNSGNSGDNGHESGYGTAPNRSRNSPMTRHQKRISLRESEDASRRQTPLAVYAHRSNAHPMTYVFDLRQFYHQLRQQNLYQLIAAEILNNSSDNSRNPLFGMDRKSAELAGRLNQELLKYFHWNASRFNYIKV
ncbi:GTPase activating protein [Dirofilaria immitis]